MLCQICHKNPASIHMQLNLNGQNAEMHLCPLCYQKVQQQLHNGGSQMPQEPFNFNSIDDLFRALNGQQMQAQQGARQSQNSQHQMGRNGNDGGLLAEFGLNLTELARQGHLDPVIGRDKEINRVVEILNRRTKNNPVLIGEAGVGKTAVVEGLAQAIVNGQVPDKLRDKEVYRLDVVSLVQGTGVRGQFEERMQKLMDEVSKNKNVILFIDEIHEIMGAGNAEGGMDAGNVLKPALARGEFQLVGATTLNEYRQIEKDPALARRFQPVTVNEPSQEEALAILQGIQKKYEDYHHVKYTDTAIKAAVTLSARYIQDRFLPDKAIDLLDEAGSRKNLNLKIVDPKEIQTKINSAEAQKQAAIEREDYEKASYWRDQVNQLERAKKEAEENPHDTGSNEITDQDLEKIVEEKTGIPVGDLKEAEAGQLRDLDKHLEAHVIGQDGAVNKVARAIRRNRVGFNKSGRPIGSFLFVGPTGVGKTETAKQLAKELFGSEDSMVRFDMSEYMEKHSVSKLIGAPAGYVGYEEAGQLTEKIRRHPYSLILLDEVEKAHPDVMHMFLQVLDDGRLTDAQGHTVSFKDTVIIMTSNAGIGDTPSVGFGSKDRSKASIIEKLSSYFKPEFLNRFDDIIEFNPLSKADLHQIVDLMLGDVNAMIADQNLHLTVEDNVADKLVDLGYNPTMGARPLRRVIQEQIEDRVADYYLDNPGEHRLVAHLVDDEIVISPEDKKVASQTVSTTDTKPSGNDTETESAE
ncbi:ATP-dependent Clp protease ATP-binding subunit [Periweissella fabalis]|uniref:AAA domain-containing protein n=1 Tax=Periweissella fabalis TaxID=1070421 RepID=A0A7X6N3W1_9LACO|nr:ATP-dependent Clp protease ATP-binding subunit [Periweissella fabalis]MCM0598201.1 AAA family ATPase [Periweissella fabalis]NKZ24864.1 AAA domain-containing protein [Periweissella fabalis]